MSKTKVPIREGLINEGKKGGLLIASRCKSCGQIFFPSTKLCFDCFGKDMEEIALNNIGTLYTYAIVYMPAHKYKPPFALGWVEFPEGVKVFGQIKGWENNPLKIDMKMQVIVDKLWDEEEKEVYGYKFEPVT